MTKSTRFRRDFWAYVALNTHMTQPQALYREYSVCDATQHENGVYLEQFVLALLCAGLRVGSSVRLERGRRRRRRVDVTLRQRLDAARVDGVGQHAQRVHLPPAPLKLLL